MMWVKSQERQAQSNTKGVRAKGELPYSYCENIDMGNFVYNSSYICLPVCDFIDYMIEKLCYTYLNGNMNQVPKGCLKEPDDWNQPNSVHVWYNHCRSKKEKRCISLEVCFQPHNIFVCIYICLFQKQQINLTWPGPGCSKLTISLVNRWLKFQTLIYEICHFFVEKM